MTLLAKPVDYTDQDFDSIRARLIQLAQSAFPEWTDFETANFGNTLLELYAFVGDILTFVQNNLARESRLVTATQRQNVMALARMLGYRLHGAGAATAEVEFRLDVPRKVAVILPKGTCVRTQEITDPIRFQLLENIELPAGALSAIGTVEHSETHQKYVDAASQKDFRITLERTPYLDGSARIHSATGDFSEVESFLNSGMNARHFVVQVDQNDRAMLCFGDGKNGRPPTGTLSVTYKTGGGAIGNVEAGRIVVLEGTHRDIHGQNVQLSVRNSRPASGGNNRQSIASAKANAPESLRAMTRSVAREDFEINARRLPGVARALMLTANEDASIVENAGCLFIVPEGGGMPTEELLRLVLRQVTEVYPCTLTFQVSVQAPIYKAVNVSAEVFLWPSADALNVKADIERRLTDFFRVSNSDGSPNNNVDFGFNSRNNAAGEIAWSDLFNVIRDTEGIRKIGVNGLHLNGIHGDMPLAAREFPVLGNITLLNGETGRPL